MASRIVLGGGLGGLAAAKYLTEAFPGEAVRILESTNRTGGYIKSVHLSDRTIFEQGPRTIRPRGEAGETTLQLIEELRLQNEIVPIGSKHPAATKRMIYANGKLHLLPTKFTSLFKTQAPFSKPLISYLIHDWRSKNTADTATKEDESIYDFTTRRFGSEVADYLISPVICGICAGNAKEISVKFLMEKLFMYEQKYGSITTGMLSNLFSGDSTAKTRPVIESQLVKRAKSEKWAVYSFKNGLETLPRALSKHLTNNGVSVDFNANVTALKIPPNKPIVVTTDKEEFTASHLVSSVAARTLAPLIQNEHPKLAELLNQIPSVSVVVINLKYNGKHIQDDAFGFLTSPKENLPILGVIFDSCCFKSNSGTVLTVMMGGFWFKKYFGSNPTDAYLTTVATKHIEQILGISEPPQKVKVSILHDCIPQYVVGHHKNVKNIESYIRSYKLPLSICGASFYGVGINDVILGAKNAVQNLAD